MNLVRGLPCLIVTLAAGLTVVQAQTAAPPESTTSTASASPTTDQTIKLDPFAVSTTKDHSYSALQSNSLSAFTMDLEKMPATAEVFSQQFITDTQSTTIEDMLINFSGIVGYSPGDTSAYTESAGDRDGSGGLSVRGFGNGGGIKIDGFFGPPSSTRSAAGSTPTFMIDRVEIIEGPQSLLYGAIGAGGVINAVYKQAMFDQSSASAYYYGNQYGSKQATIDYNASAGPIAVRFSATNQDNATIRQNLGNSTEGYYLQVAGEIGHTIIRYIHNKYETDALNGFNPSLKPFISSTSPLYNDTTQYIAETGQVPAGIFGGNVNWQNVDSFAGDWGAETSTIVNDEVEIDSTVTPWFSTKLTALYGQYQDWRNTTSITLEPGSTAGNPYSYPAIQLSSPNMNYQSQRQRAAQLNMLFTNDFFHDTAKSQTVLGGYLNHVGPSFGSSGITYQYIQADSNFNPVVGTGTADYGHILIPSQWIPVSGGQIIRYPVFNPGQSRVTLNGTNYILEPRIVQSAAYKGFPIPGVPTNPYGLVPNGSANLSTTAPGGAYTFNGTFNPGTEEHEQFMMLGNYTTWFDGKLATLAGVSIDKAISYNFGATSTSFLPWTRYNGWEIGVIYQITDWMGAYLDDGTAATPAGSTHDLYGNSLAPPSAKGTPELGLKFHTKDQAYAAQLAWDIQTQDADELTSVDGSYLNAVNPSGLNGRYGGSAANTFVNTDRTSTNLEFTATANPTPNWRMRFNIGYTFARILDNVSYGQLYNDQFATNAAGQVTYGNGTVMYVNGTATTAAQAAIVTAATAGATPLTTAMISNPASPYYATPDPSSGSITNSTLKTILTTGGSAGSVGISQVAANGESATSVTGLPLSKNQYGFVSPFPANSVLLYAQGNPTTGYPGWQWNIETDYTLAKGPLTGLGAFASATAQYSTRAYYTYYPSSSSALGSETSQVVNETRILTVLPTVANVSLGIHYTRKIWRATLTTRLTVSDLFNHDPFYVLPQASNGTYLAATQRVNPRYYAWSATLGF